jgi:DNA-binding response OmpR family regulator
MENPYEGKFWGIDVKALIAEDDTTSRIVLEKRLSNWGYEVLVAKDGNQALEIIRSQRPEIVLVDWMMPMMDGLELCRKIRELQDSGYTYIIFLTSKTENEDIVTALDAGADDYLPKPFDKNVLKSRMAVGARTINYKNELRIAKEKAMESQVKLEKLNLQLEITYKKLMETAHNAGMAEVAANVLHNVGNALNSINVSAALVTEKVTNSEIANLAKLAELFGKHSSDLADFLTNDPQGKHIPAYLAEVSSHLSAQEAETIEKLYSLMKNVEDVKNIVQMQQLYAKTGEQQENVSLNELIENAIEINKAGLERQNIEIIREYADIGNILIDRQRILQILVNLIDNAEYALLESGKGPKLLKIRTAKSGNSKVRIEVIDNGIGIKADDLSAIFKYGHTTKQGVHGFGLHSSLLAAKDMQATLTAQSSGPNQGATFVLELPLRKTEVKPPHQYPGVREDL